MVIRLLSMVAWINTVTMVTGRLKVVLGKDSDQETTCSLTATVVDRKTVLE